MPLSQRALELLQSVKKPRVRLRTGQDVLKYGDDYDPAESTSKRQPGSPQWVSSAYDAAPTDRIGGTKEITEQLRSVGDLGKSANLATAEAVAYRREEQRLKMLAEQTAQNERSGEVSNYINSLQAASPNVNLSGAINPGDFKWIKGKLTYTGKTPLTFDSPSGGGPGGVSSRRQTVLNAAKKYIGTNYQWGGGGGLSRGHNGPSYGDTSHGTNYRGFDCSGLTDYAYSKLGWKIGTFTGTQNEWAARRGKAVPKSKLVPGDIIFGGGSPGSPGGIHHVAIYWGNGKIIEAPSTGLKVRITKMRAGQWGYHLNY